VDPSIREEGRAKVEYEIDAGELLEGLDEDTRECAEADATMPSRWAGPTPNRASASRA